MFILTLFVGGIAIPIGILLDLDPWILYIVTTTGSIAFMLTFLALGERLTKRFFPDAEDRVAGSRARSFLDRWGVPGLAIIGGTLLGPTVTLLAAVVLGVDRRRFARWYSAATVVGFALFTLFWSALLT